MIRLAVVMLVGCGGGAMPVQNRKMTQDPALACEVSVAGQDLTLVLVNATDRPRTLAYHRPYMELELKLTERTGGAARSIMQPAIDMPVERAELVVPPRGKATLATPIRLRFASDPGDASPFTWVISGAPAPLDIAATLRFDEDRTKLSCRGSM
jgi:hypothetical protein